MTQAWVDEANKLQKKVLELDQAKAQLKEAQDKLEQADNMDSTLQRYIDEREEMWQWLRKCGNGRSSSLRKRIRPLLILIGHR